jgi:hypothetical protein
VTMLEGTNDNGLPVWFGLLREDITAMRLDMNARLDRLVTQDAFSAEQRRVNEELARVKADQATEATTRATADANEAAARKADNEALESKQAKNGVWIRWGVGLAIGIPGAYIAWSGFLAAGGAQ